MKKSTGTHLKRLKRLKQLLAFFTTNIMLILSTKQEGPTSSEIEMYGYGTSNQKVGFSCPPEANRESIIAYWYKRKSGSTVFPHLKFDLGPAAGTFINDASGNAKYTLYETFGGSCMETDPKDQNPFFFAFTFKYSGDPNLCRATHLLVATDSLRPCTNPTAANEIYTLLNVVKDKTDITLDQLVPNMRINVLSTYKKLLVGGLFYFYNFYNLEIPGDFNDELVEFIVTRATMKTTSFFINRFSHPTFFEMREAYQQQGRITFNAEQFFKKHTHNSLVGFHLEPLSRTLNPVLPKEWRITKELKAEESSHSLLFQGYISDPNSIDVGHELYIFFEVKGNNNVHKYFKYKMKITRDTVAPQLSVALYDATTNALRVEMSNWISIDDNHTPRYWLHFALCIGMGARYYKAPSSGTGIEANFKIYETMAFYYNDDIYQKITSFNADGPIQQMIPNFFDNNREADRILYHSIWIDMNSAAMTPQPGIDPGVRMFSYSQSKGAFPAPLNPKLSGTQNANPKNRCFLKTVEAHSCFAFAFLKDMEDKMDKFLLQNSYKTCNGEQTKSPRRCRYCTDNRNCLVPFQGYNRELSYSGQKSYFIPTRTASEINAAQEAQEYIDFQDNLGVNYKIRCPFGCKEF